MQLSGPAHRHVRAAVLALLVLAACRQPAGRGDPVGVTGVTVDLAAGTVGVDADVAMRTDVACNPGLVARRTADGWECIAPNALAPLAWPTGSCNPGDTLLRTDAGWQCGQATDRDVTPVLVSCAAGTYVRRAATGWECAPIVDSRRTPNLASCPSGRFVGGGPQGVGFTCADPVDPATTPVLTECAEGLHVLRTLDGWACARVLDPVVTPVVDACPTGTWVRRTADGWSCAIAVDPVVTPIVDACPAGRFVRATSAGWTCAATIDPATTPILAACTSGSFVRSLGTNAWGCAPTIDPTRTPVVPGCAEGRFVRRNAAGNGWECSGPVADVRFTPVLDACAAGRLVRKTSTGWDCVVPPPDAQRTPVIASCATDRWVRRTTGGWSCETLSGTLTGNVTGNVTGTVTGDVVGPVTGDAGGTADNVRGIVGFTHGGTGLSSVPAGQLLRSTGTAFAPYAAPMTLAPEVLRGTGTEWSTAAPDALGLVFRGFLPRTVFVRPDGSDTACNGRADVATTGGGECALASLQAAIDRVDTLGTGNATIHLSPGTYRVAAAGATLADFSRRRVQGDLVIEGNGAILSGATELAPTVAVSATGLMLSETRSSLLVRNVVIERFASIGINVAGANVSLEGVTIRNIGAHGLFCARNASCAFVGGSLSEISDVGSMGIYGRQNAAITSASPLTIRNAAAHGIYVDFGANASFGGTSPLTVRDSGGLGIAATLRATVFITAPVSILNNDSWGVYAAEGGRIDLRGGGTITNGGVNTGAIVATGHASIRIIVNTGVTLSVACESGTSSLGFLSQVRSNFVVSGVGTVALTNCANGIIAAWRSSFVATNEGVRTVVTAVGGANDGVGFYASQLSFANRGSYPAQTGCYEGSICL